MQQGGTTYTYDDNGNTISETLDGNTIAYSYDAKNQLIETDNAGAVTSYSYNPDGIRSGKASAGQATSLVVDSNRDYAQVLLEVTNGATNAAYTYGDDLISQTRNSATSFYHYDGLGSTRALTDGSGAITDSYNYEAFGQLLNQTGTTENDYLFTGEQYDPGLDQYYLRARYYDPSQGRFTQMDSFPGFTGLPVTAHKYIYANADPANFIDPTGHFSLGSLGTALNIMGRLATTSVRAVGSSAFRFARTVSKLSRGTVRAGRTALIRVQYMKRVRGLQKIANEMRRNGKSVEEIAKVMNKKRRALGRLFKNVTDSKTRQYAFNRNLRKYGDKWGPTWQYLRRQGRSWEDIVESATRPNSSLQELIKIFFGR